MKTFVSGVAAYLNKKPTRRNSKLLLKFVVVLVAVVAIYSTIFHYLMEMEGQQHSWVTGFYWTLTVMSTLGFGDITFEQDIGRFFSVVVLLSGMIFLLILMPFTLIEFFYAPWMERQAQGKIPRNVPKDWNKHVILTHDNAVSEALAKKLKDIEQNAVFVTPDDQEVIRLQDRGFFAIKGALTETDTYERAGIQRASLVAVVGDDVSNANTVFTVKSLPTIPPVISMASNKAASEVIRLAGADHVFQLAQMMGEALARRVVGSGAADHVIGSFDPILLAETTARGTSLVGKTVAELKLPQRAGVNLVGLWEQGTLSPVRPDSRIEFDSVLVLSGTNEQFQKFDEISENPSQANTHVVVIGGGRVGLATAATLKAQGLDYRIIELEKDALGPLGEQGVFGNAANFEVLQKAGIIEADSVIITSNNDEMDIYLTIFCRKLRPDIQIISRATAPENIKRLHKAGANVVMSYANMGSNHIMNFLKGSDTLIIAEGLSAFRAPIPLKAIGKNLIELALRQSTGCNVLAVTSGGKTLCTIDPHQPLQGGDELLLIGDSDSENRFRQLFGS